jgi:hypothetical protein
MCWTPITRAKKNNVNKTCAILQTTGGKDEPNIVCMRTSQHGTLNVTKHNRTTQKTKKMSNTVLRSYTIHDLHFYSVSGHFESKQICVRFTLFVYSANKIAASKGPMIPSSYDEFITSKVERSRP